MASSYPAAVDTIAAPGAQLSTSPGHTVLHTATKDAVLAVQAVLGVNPQGAAASVAARLAALTATATGAESTAAAVSTTLDAVTAELGTNPSGGSATVAARFDTLAPADIPWTTVTGVVTSGTAPATIQISSTLRYRHVAGRTCEWECQIFLLGTPTAGGTFVIACPVAPLEYGSNCGQVVGNALMLNSGYGRRSATVFTVPGGGGSFQLDVGAGGYQSVVTAAVPWTWKGGDEIVASGSFRYA